MPAIIISRVSTEDQKIQGNSLPAQDARILKKKIKFSDT
jgi:hypothetical protein